MAQQNSQSSSITSYTEFEILKAEVALLRSKLSDEPRQSVASIGDVAPRPVNPLTTVPPSANTNPKNGFTFNGFVDGSSYQDNRSSLATFGLNQVEVNATKEFADRVSARADIEYISGLDGSFSFDVEQGFVSIALDKNNSFAFTFGKFNAPIGLEAVDPHEMWQYSWGLTATTLPSNLTGFMLSGPLTSSLTLTAYATNGWDLNADNNKGKTIGALAEYSFSEQFSLSVGVISGPEQDTVESSNRSMLDFVGSGKIGPVEYGAEYLTGVETKLSLTGGDTKWNSGLLSAKWNFAPGWALLTRVSQFNDMDGIWSGFTQRQQEMTFSPSYSPVTGLTLLAEIRFDKSNQPSFEDVDGNFSDNKTSSALEITYAF